MKEKFWRIGTASLCSEKLRVHFRNCTFSVKGTVLNLNILWINKTVFTFLEGSRTIVYSYFMLFLITHRTYYLYHMLQVLNICSLNISFILFFNFPIFVGLGFLSSSWKNESDISSAVKHMNIHIKQNRL